MTRRADILLLTLVCFMAFFVHNGVILPDIMECRNLVTAREAVEEGNYLVPTMNGELRLEKPPLPTWIAAGIERIAPDRLCLQRAAAGMAATLLVLFFYLFGETFTQNRRYALFASLILCTSYSLVLMGRTATWDIYCHAFMMGALYFLYRGCSREGRRWGDFAACGLLLGLSFMSKGPVAFYALLLPFLVCAFAFRIGSLRGKWAPLLLMLLLCVAVSSWWYIYLLTFHPAEVQWVLQKESTAWVNHNVRPWWYYYKFFLETGIWSLLLLTALAIPYWLRKSTAARREYLFPTVWLLVMLVLLSCMPEKKPRYLLPILIPAAYAVGYVIEVWTHLRHTGALTRTDHVLFRVNGWLLATVAAALPVGVFVLLGKHYLTFLPCAIAATLFAAAAALLIKAVLDYRAPILVGGVVLLMATAEVLVMPAVGPIANNRNRNSIAAIRGMRCMDGIPLYYNANEEAPRIEIIYEAHRRIRPLNLADSAAVAHALPLGLLTHGSIRAEVPAATLSAVDTLRIGRFDNNQRQRTAHRYNACFIYNLTILKAHE